MSTPQRIRFRGATYSIVSAEHPESLDNLVTASLLRRPGEDTVTRLSRLIKLAKMVSALEAPPKPSGTKPPPIPQVGALKKLKGTVVEELDWFFKHLQKGAAVFDQALKNFAEVVESADAAVALPEVAKQIQEVAKVFPALRQEDLPAKIEDLANSWQEWSDYVQGSEFLNKFRFGRQRLRQKLFDIQRPIARVLELVEK